jgi:mRNA-degrading endonuclease toxin of MazEF toxin-antitoxin module
MIRRGDVVIVDFPFIDTRQSKVRPALVVQNDRDNQVIRKTVVAMITGNTNRKNDPSHLFVGRRGREGRVSGSFEHLSSCPARITGLEFPQARIHTNEKEFVNADRIFTHRVLGFRPR